MGQPPAPIQRKYPAKINIYNLKYFFDFKSITPSQIIPGMLVQFSYRSPEGVHDVKPLVYVLEVEQDRVWGINVHYNFKLLESVVVDKQLTLSKVKPQGTTEDSTEKTIGNDPTPRPEQLNQRNIPSLEDNKGILNKDSKPKVVPVSKPKYPQQLLETYTMQQIPANILRNYLYSRTSSITKLVFKAL